jgi:alkanesulfonate monooxygenase SsuD/methylene tetrahydromethanopterin reductase-like flavin-dependent oxidoreductase (luciferase family)
VAFRCPASPGRSTAVGLRDQKQQRLVRPMQKSTTCTAGDHVSFFVGAGYDGLIAATSLLALQPSLPVYVGLYLSPLRHPVAVDRQLASIAQLAPGRSTLGVGIGGEDRHEIEICGVDPRTRGRRMDEALQVLRALADGTSVTFEGEFFTLHDALILRAPTARP